MADKKLNIGVKVDVKELGKFQKALSDLAAMGNKTAKSLSSIAIGGSSPMQKGALAKSLLEQTSLFKGMGKEATALAKTLKETVGKSTDELAANVKRTTRELKTMLNEQGRLERELRTMRLTHGNSPSEQASIKAMEQKIGSVRDAVTNKAGQQVGAQRELDALGGSPQSGGMMGLLKKMIGAAAAGAFVLNNAAAGADLYQNGQLMGLEAQGKFRQTLATGYRKLKAGDLKDLYAESLIGANPQLQGIMKHAGSMTAAEIKSSAQGISGLAGILNPMGSNFLSIGAVSNFAKAKLNAPVEAVENLERVKAAVGAANPLRSDVVDYASGNAASRMGMIRRFGSKAKMDAGFKAAAHMGMSPEEFMSMAESLRTSGGTNISQAGSVLGLQATTTGMGAGAAGNILGLGAVGGQGQTLLKGVAKAIQEGKIDITAAENIGTFTVNQMINGNGMTSGQGLMAAMINAPGFTGGAGDRLIASQLQGGLQGFGNLMSGGLDAYQQGLNVVNAAGIVGKRGSFNLINELATNIDTRTMFDVLGGGDVGNNIKFRGGNKDDVRQMAQKTILDRMQSGLVTADDPNSSMAQVAKAFIEAGGNKEKFLGSNVLKGMSQNDIAENLGFAIKDAGMATTNDAATGMARLYLSGGKLDDKFTARDRAGGTSEEILAKGMEEAATKFREEVAKMDDQLKKLGSILEEAMKSKMGLANTEFSSAGVEQATQNTIEFAQALSNAKGDVEAFRKALGGKHSGAPPPNPVANPRGGPEVVPKGGGHQF